MAPHDGHAGLRPAAITAGSSVATRRCRRWRSFVGDGRRGMYMAFLRGRRATWCMDGDCRCGSTPPPRAAPAMGLAPRHGLRVAPPLREGVR